MVRSIGVGLFGVLAFAWSGCAASDDGGFTGGDPGDTQPGAASSSSGAGSGDGGASDAGHSGDGGAGKPDSGTGVPTKGLWIFGGTIRGHESAFVGWADAHKYTDVYLLVKDTSGAVKYDVISAVMNARASAKSHLRVWAWVAGFQDSSHDPAWSYVEGDMVAPTDATYQAHLAQIVRSLVDPSGGNVPEPPDGVMLDDTFEWPGPTYGGTTDQKVAALMADVDAIVAQVAPVRAATGKTIHLGFAPHPETTVVSSSSKDIVTQNAASYGQDFGEIGKRCDWMVPQTYRYGYSSNPSSWIAQVVSDVHKELALEDGANAASIEVTPALVLMQSDTNPAPVAPTDLAGDLASAKAAGGYSVFRYLSSSANPGNDADSEDLPTAAQEAVLDGAPPPSMDAGSPPTVGNPLSPVVGYEQVNLTESCGSCGSHSGAVCMGFFYGTSSVSTVTSVENDIYGNYGLPCGPGSSSLASAYTKYLANNNLPWTPVVFQDSSQVLGYLQKGSPVVAHTRQWGGHYVAIYGLVTGSSGKTTVYFSDGAYDDGLNNTLPTGNLKQWDWSTFLGDAAIGDYIGFVHK